MIFFSCMPFCFAKAQFLDGFFSQQSQQRKLMAAQVAQYEIYLSALKAGYRISQTGLSATGNFKNEALSLNAVYFRSLQQVNPLIKNSPRGTAIVEMGRQLRRLFDAELSWQKKRKLLTDHEIAYLAKVAGNLLEKCRDDENELLQVLTPGRLNLHDAERLERLDALYEHMTDKYSFAMSFTGRCRKLALSRKQQAADHGQTKKLYGIY